MRQFFKLSLLLLSLLPISLQAKHIIGGEINYECLGETAHGSNINRYYVTMIIYRDCDPNSGGAFFDVPANFSIFRNNDVTPYQTFTVTDVLITNIIPDTPACIQTVPYLCVERGEYNFYVELPISNTTTYTIVYQRCCRNNSIVNIIDPESVGATYSVEILPAAQNACNNSPVYTEFPPILICKDAPLIFDHSATDQDGDLLVYSFCAPQIGGGPILTFPGYNECGGAQPVPPCAPPFPSVPFVVPQFSPGNPIGGNPQITINPVTGLIKGTPKEEGRYVVGVCVDEYRNGVLMSTVKRDFQFNIVDCDPLVQTEIAGGDTLVLVALGKYFLSQCGTQPLNIENKSKDKNFIKEDFRWEFIIGGQLQVFNDWSPTIEFPAAGSYRGTLFLKPGSECADTAFVDIDIYPDVTADFSYAYDTCVAGLVTFTNLSNSDGIIDTWNWKFGVPNGKSEDQNPEFTYPVPGLHAVQLFVEDQNGCTDRVTKPILYQPAPQIIIIQPNSYVGCAPARILFNNLSTPIDETYKIDWTFGDGGDTTGVISPEHIYTETGIYDVTVAITSPIGCMIADTFPELIRIVPSPVADFTFTPDKVTILEPTLTFNNLSQESDRFFWQFDRFGTSNEFNPTFTFRDTGMMRILLVATHPQGCKDTLAKYIDIQPEVRWFMPNAFTPNGDGSNDGFFGKGYLVGAKDFKMTIWNRWGELVFETDNPDEQWNGRAGNDGEMSPAGVYVYRVTFVGPRGEQYDYRGFSTLVK